MDFSDTFLETYKNERKFLMMNFQESHEGTYEVVKTMDQALSDYL